LSGLSKDFDVKLQDAKAIRIETKKMLIFCFI
jgi:hypothetical protein